MLSLVYVFTLMYTDVTMAKATNKTERFASAFTKVFVPDSLAAIPEGEKGYDAKIASKVAPNLSLIQAGDLILTRTSSRLYNILRTLTSESFDHIAVVLNDKLVLHIGPGRIRTLSLIRLLEPKRSPIVLRPILTSKEKSDFLKKCESMIGGHYDLVRIFDFVLRLILLNWTRIKIPFRKVRVDFDEFAHNKSKKLWLCSDAIMNALISVHPKFKHFLVNDMESNEEYKEIMLNNLGSLTIEDFMTMAKQSNDLFKIIKLPLQSQSNDDTKTNNILKQYMNKFNELSIVQKVLLVVLIAFVFDKLTQRRSHSLPSRSKL